MGKLDIEDRSNTIDVEQVRPAADYILLQSIQRDKTRGGLILPAGENIECAFGRVIRLGEGPSNVVTGETYPMPYKRGDVLLTMQYMGEKIYQRDEEYRLVREQGIWAKLTLSTRDTLEILKVEPVKDCVVIQVDKDSITSGGLHLPGGQKTENCKGRVLSVGGGHRNLKTGAIIKPSVEAGQTVIFRRYAGAELQVKGYENKLRIMQDRDIFAVIEG